MANVYVEYIDHITGDHNTEKMSWNAFCNASLEPHIEITFCCLDTDPRVNAE